MYATCLFCQRGLGANDEIEVFPVGRRLAYDEARGRLWVVCPHCARWNLTPAEERWEAIEACERLFRGARVRSATGEIALARTAAGLSLVRVGKAPAPELAVWRYGRALRARLERTALLAGAGAAAAGGVAASGAAGLLTIPAAITQLLPLAGLVVHPLMALIVLGRGRFRPVRVRSEEGKVLEVFRADFDGLHLVPAGDGPAGRWGVTLRHGYGTATLRGEAATNALRPILARVNRLGALPGAAREAAAWTAAQGGAAEVLARAAHASAAVARAYERQRRAFESGIAFETSLVKVPEPRNASALHRLPRVERLALEMALSDEAERRAMEEELAPLAAAWREAEEIAAIADGLLVPADVETRLGAMKAGKR